MNPWQRLLRKLRLDADLDEELRCHAAMDVRNRIERGEEPDEAARNARRLLGNDLLIKEVTRDMWGWSSIDALKRDVHYAFRQIRRTPGFTAVAFLTFALGLGATVTIFSIVNAVLLEPLHFRDPGRLYLARTAPPRDSGITGNFPVNARHFHEWQTRCRACESSALVQFQDLTLVGEGDPVKLPALSVSAGIFRTLGVQPAIGRDFLPGEGTPGRADVVILSDALWRSRFGGNPGIIGERIRLNGEAHTVVGVMGSELHLPKGDEWGSHFGPAAEPVIFRPLLIDPSRERPAGNLNYSALIRLKPGVSATQAASELNALLAGFVRDFKLQTSTVLVPFSEQVKGGYQFALWSLLAMIGAVLLIVCVNVGNLMLVRTACRYREAGVRMALGASRSQVLRLVLTEASILVAAGGATGPVLAQIGLQAFVAWGPIQLPRLAEIHLDWQVFIFAGAAIALCTVTCGLFPALRLSRIDPQESLKSGTLTATESRSKLHAREVLVGIEVALSTVLLILGGLLLMSFYRVVKIDKGFEVARIITQDVSYLSPKYAHGVRRQRIEETIAGLSQIPGVQVAAAINVLPLRGDDWIAELEDPDQPARTGDNRALTNFRFVTPGYWQAIGIALKEGRLLDDFDKNQPRAVISQRVAQILWPGQSALGRHVRGVGPKSPSLEVVGVVGDVRAKGLERDPAIIVYEHFWRMEPVSMSYVVRTYGNAASVAGAIRSELAAMDPEMAIMRPWTMEEIVEQSLAMRRFQLCLAVAFAASALLLASLGVYGVISYTVASRTPEIGIRAALGATAYQQTTMVLFRGMRPVVLGLSAGLLGALFASRLMGSQLFRVTPWDPITFTGVALLLLSVGVAACWGPARRAARMDPVEALRFE